MRGAYAGPVALMLPQCHWREPPIAPSDGSKLPCFRIPDVDVADVSGIVSHLEPTQAVAPWDEGAQPRRIIVQREQADALRRKGGALQELPTEGNISAVNIPHASLVFDLHDVMEVTADLLGERGRATETIPYANIVSFTCLKAFAFNHRREGKDAHDLVYCLEHGDGGLDGAIAKFKDAMSGAHRGVIDEALAILLKRFCDPREDEGYLREGPVAVARFEIVGDDEEAEVREQRALRQRNVNDLASRLLAELNIRF